MSEPSKVRPIRRTTAQPKPEESAFVIALHIGSFSIRLVFARVGHTPKPSRKQRRAEARAKAEAEAARWREIDQLMAAQAVLRNARKVA